MGTSSTNLVHSLVKVASTALVLSSIGFGAVFAFKASIHGGIILAGLAVLMAAALEAIKPLAIAQAFQAFGNWSPFRGLALLFLGLIAVAYSLTSELSLMSASRGDLTAERAQAHTSQTMARDAYERARAELSTLKPSRTVGEVEALIAKQSANGCGVANSGGKWVCPVNTSLLSELARAKRRAELEAVMQTNAAQVASGLAVASADPGSVNLATYLSALGLGNVSLVIIDPISSYLGKIDSNKNAEVRGLIAPLQDVMTKHNVCVLGVTHLNKGGQASAMYRVTGSLAFVAAARTAFLVDKDSNDPNSRVMVPLKNNLFRGDVGFSFKLDSVDLGEGIQTSRTIWGSETYQATADDVLTDNSDHGAVAEAKDFQKVRWTRTVSSRRRNVPALAKGLFGGRKALLA